MARTAWLGSVFIFVFRFGLVFQRLSLGEEGCEPCAVVVDFGFGYYWRRSSHGCEAVRLDYARSLKVDPADKSDSVAAVAYAVGWAVGHFAGAVSARAGVGC